MKVLVIQSCPTLCNSMDCSPPGSSIHGILKTRILDWFAISFSRGSSWPRDRTQVSYTAGEFFIIWATISLVYAKFFFLFFFWDLVFKFPRSFLVMKKRKSRIVLLLLSVLFLKKILSTTTGKIWNFLFTAWESQINSIKRKLEPSQKTQVK